jgi:SnoaL-like domain
MSSTSDDATIRAAIVRYLGAGGDDRETAHDIYHDDAILEFPQSGERFIGRKTIREWRERYPSSTRFRLRRITGSGATWTAEVLISYDGGPWMFGVAVYMFRSVKVARECVYVMDGFPAAEWRAPWATRFDPLASTSPSEWQDGVPFGIEAQT